ncbi:cysteine desulfurase family protein [Aureimonas sp. ME7]|uniref:cysteine desulfurase family protein n=1 Tax=Aureimonas sp. ME7 TaxID=2744252 RepID=UPI0015F696BD|nr:cysteine desulfurase family protein [Aureimonas sp. ME7]
MQESRIYLDHNASSPLINEARDAVLRALEFPGNPSSVHSEGRVARSVLDEARAAVASLVGAHAHGVVFTSGATEAAATCLTPHWQRGGQPLRLSRLAVLETDHPCLLQGGRFETDEVTRLPVSADGVVSLGALNQWLEAGEPGLVALCSANSETGVLQPVEEIGACVRASGSLFVCDCVQLAGRMPIDMATLSADAAIVSAHKMGGPKGIGAFVLRNEGLRPAPLLTGGAQEKRQRAGTEALPLIAGFGAASHMARDRAMDGAKLLHHRERIESRLTAVLPGLSIVGEGAARLPQTLAFHHPALRGETVQIAMDLAGFAVSSGSACSSGKVESSHVLRAMQAAGASIDAAKGAVRVSFDHRTTELEIDRFLSAFAAYAARTIPADPPRKVA